MAKKKGSAKGAKSAPKGAKVSGDEARRLAREAVRRSQRLASQLHQLIAASITITALRDEPAILAAVAESARDVFDAAEAVVTFESPTAPLRAVAPRGGESATSPFDPVARDDRPGGRDGRLTAWTQGDWLVAPVLEQRDRLFGVVGVEREDGGFGDEDREILTLLAQLTATALAATELNRTIESNEARLSLLVETAPVGLVEVDATGEVQWWNGPASRLLAWPERPGAGAATPSFPPAVHDDLAELWAEVLDTGEPGGRELEDVPIGNRRRHWTVTATALPVTGAATPAVLTLIDDVTDTRQLRAEVRHAHTMEMRGQVASRLAHDFNNLLTLVSGYAEILSQNLRGDERSLQMVRDIQSTASRASLLTRQLQTIGRTKIAAPVLFNPITVIASNAEVLERIMGSAVEVQWQLEENAGAVKVDADQFEQMIINLSLNARDAMPDGGRLTIGVRRSSLDEDRAAALGVSPGTYVHLAVTDTGVGMDDETRQHCFDPLFTTKGPFKGTGMGLAAAQRLAGESGGAIECTSAPGQGTTFDVYLPFAGEASAAPAPPVAAESPRGSATLLLVDDDEGLRRLMSQVLTRNGYRVVEAASGEEAATLFDEVEGGVDLLVSDVVMGEVSGRDLASSLQERRPGLKVLLTSGTAEAGVVEGLGPGRAAFLAKPFKPSGLIDAVHELLTRA
jgi:two-component system cell cycle sensor histidine kinase/response regulator CckA